VPYLIGANADEGVLFHLEAGVLPVTTEADYEAALRRRFGGRAVEILAVYSAANFASPEAAIRRVTGDFELVCETNDSARRAADAGLDVYSYDFSVAFELAPLDPGTAATKCAAPLDGGEVRVGPERPEESVYPVSTADADGPAYIGTNRYVLHFDAADLPPVDGASGAFARSEGCGEHRGMPGHEAPRPGQAPGCM
jgi:hypothetical protein